MTLPHAAPSPDHPALIALYSIGGAVALLAGVGFLYLGVSGAHGDGDTVPIDTILGAVLAPFGALSVAGGAAMRWQWRALQAWRMLPFMWLLGCGIGAVAAMWIVR